MKKVKDTQVRAFSISDVDIDFVKKSDGVIFGAPTYGAGTSAEFCSWLETNAGALNLAGKLGGAFSTGGFIHGGADINIQTILTHLLFQGMMVYSSGCAFGAPVIHIGPAGIGGNISDFKDLFETYWERFANQTAKLK